MFLLGLVLIGWFAVLALVIQYGPDAIMALGALIQALTALVKRIREKNPQLANTTELRDAIQKGLDVAGEVIHNLKTRADLTEQEKRDLGYLDLQATLKARYGIILPDTEAIRLLHDKYSEMKVAKEI